MAKTIALVACVSKKNNMPMVAKDLYISDWFKKASAYVETISDKWYILSAKYGLVDPSAIIEHYNETLSNISVSKRCTWSIKCSEVCGQMIMGINQENHTQQMHGGEDPGYVKL